MSVLPECRQAVGFNPTTASGTTGVPFSKVLAPYSNARTHTM